jgi:hypothetical protein
VLHKSGLSGLILRFRIGVPEHYSDGGDTPWAECKAHFPVTLASSKGPATGLRGRRRRDAPHCRLQRGINGEASDERIFDEKREAAREDLGGSARTPMYECTFVRTEAAVGSWDRRRREETRK